MNYEDKVAYYVPANSPGTIVSGRLSGHFFYDSRGNWPDCPDCRDVYYSKDAAIIAARKIALAAIGQIIVKTQKAVDAVA